MVKAVVRPRPDNKFDATVEDDENVRVFWGPVTFDDHSKAFEKAVEQRDKVLRDNGKRR